MRESSKGAGQGARTEPRKALPAFSLLVTLVLVAVLCLPLTPDAAELPSPFAADGAKGRKAADFMLKDVNGNMVSLASYKGKVVLLNFWATYCPPCREEIPDMNELNKKMKGKPFVILAVSTDRAAVDVRDFMKKTPMNFPVLLDYNNQVSRTLYKVFMIPTTFLIDKRGNIAKIYYGGQEWTEPAIVKEIEALL
ncbi:MAG: TlpA family protein disulfide reductase [Alphaproteobacteria bacterium]|uniref:TlpA family protein disulfide reductase n=1 Tax=Candidatus Nitrobium versatile TaxID=2884831 RepID=A0A953J2I1_9BACT|nr:TlpA family protein disulfide reductase [Candidatus Nitrobium versatile]